MMKKLLVLLALLPLTGCLASAGISGLPGTIEQAGSQIDMLLPQLILLKYAALHNLKVGLQQIDAQPGMVTMMQQPPVVWPNPTVPPVITLPPPMGGTPQTTGSPPANLP